MIYSFIKHFRLGEIIIQPSIFHHLAGSKQKIHTHIANLRYLTNYIHFKHLNMLSENVWLILHYLNIIITRPQYLANQQICTKERKHSVKYITDDYYTDVKSNVRVNAHIRIRYCRELYFNLQNITINIYWICTFESVFHGCLQRQLLQYGVYRGNLIHVLCTFRIFQQDLLYVGLFHHQVSLQAYTQTALEPCRVVFEICIFYTDPAPQQYTVNTLYSSPDALR